MRNKRVNMCECVCLWGRLLVADTVRRRTISRYNGTVRAPYLFVAALNNCIFLAHVGVTGKHEKNC